MFQLYNRLKYEVPNYTEKLSLIIGDIEQPSLGLSKEDRNKLTNVVNIIYHCAAYVRFNETLTNAVKNKVQSTKYVMDLARDCKALKVTFIYFIDYLFTIITRSTARNSWSPKFLNRLLITFIPGNIIGTISHISANGTSGVIINDISLYKKLFFYASLSDNLNRH